MKYVVIFNYANKPAQGYKCKTALQCGLALDALLDMRSPLDLEDVIILKNMRQVYRLTSRDLASELWGLHEDDEETLAEHVISALLRQ